MAAGDFKITVLKRTYYPELVDTYCQVDPGPCSKFADGEEITCQMGQQPEGFCSWAWNDIHKVLFTLAQGGGFDREWMKAPNTMVTCCTDGLRPVIFKVERMAG